LTNQIESETDPAKQHLLYGQLNDFYLDQSWAMILLQNPEHIAARAGVRGLRYDGHQALALAEVWLA
jgi:hypothetical protein